MRIARFYPENFDDCDVTDLEQYAEQLRGAPPAVLGMRETTRNTLLCYIEAKIGAIEARLAGRIGNAQYAEARCDYYYKQLPKKWRW